MTSWIFALSKFEKFYDRHSNMRSRFIPSQYSQVLDIKSLGERGGSVVEYRTPEREVGGSKPTSAVLCP